MSLPVISKKQLGKRVYFINKAVKDLQAEIQKNPDNELLKQRVKELYSLKTKVLLKLLEEGHVSVSFAQIDGCDYYVFRVDRLYSFHMPRTVEVREAVKKYGRKKRNTSRHQGQDTPPECFENP